MMFSRQGLNAPHPRVQARSDEEADVARPALPPRRALGTDSATQGAFAREASIERQQRLHTQPDEAKCYEILVRAYRELGKSDGDDYHDRFITFLTVLETVVRTLAVETESRLYRDKFSPGYRNLFPDYNLRYRVDVFDSCVTVESVVWVNGEEFRFSPKAIAGAKALQDAFAWLYNSLGAEDEFAPPLQILRSQLARLDKAWANFEMIYISELIAVERKSKDLVLQAIKEETLLHKIENEKAGSAQCREQRRRFVSCISKLNSVANVSRKGRADLDASILEEVEERLREYKRGSSTSANAAGALAMGMVESLNAIRTYFYNVAENLDRVDPHLSNNPGLVEHLVEWEETWEIGAKYLRDESSFQTLVVLVEKLRRAWKYAPGFKDMCIERDVELFLIIPRLIWLIYLSTPAEFDVLLRTFLPHRFSPCIDPEMKRLQDRFSKVQQLCVTHAPMIKGQVDRFHDADANSDVLEILISCALADSGRSRTLEAVVPVPARKVLKEAIDEFMHEVERWSMELQRHSALDWNQCCSLIVRCLDESSKDTIQATKLKI